MQQAANCSLHPKLLHPLALGPIFQRWITWRNDRLTRGIASQWDVMHVTNPLHYVFGISIPVVVTIHDLIPLEYPHLHLVPSAIQFYQVKIPKIIEDASCILVNSFYTAERVLHYFPEAESKLQVTQLAAAPIFFPREVPDAYLRQYGIHRPFVLYVGSMRYPRKNVLGLLQAFARISPRFPELQLVLVGQMGTQEVRRKIFQQLADLRLTANVRILEGLIAEEIANLYAAATVFCYPPFVEGFGLPVLEAMQSGCPVVTSNLTSLPEVAGDAAVLVDPSNVAELAEAIAAVVESEQLQQQLRQKGLQQAAKFSWEKTAQLTAESYQRVLGRSVRVKQRLLSNANVA